MSGSRGDAEAWVLRTRFFSRRVPRRSVSVAIALAVIAASAAAVSLCVGDYPLPLTDVLAALVGRGDDFAAMLVLEWRLPIALAAIVFGALLGIGGAIFQSITRNPLGSPDVIGFDAGAYTAVVICMLVIGRADTVSLTVAALSGGLATAAIVYVLAYRGGLHGFRFIVIGIGVSALLGAVNAYLISRAALTDAMTVGFWGAGSIAKMTWSSLVPVLVVTLAVVIVAAAMTPRLRRLELGDSIAIAQGASIDRERALLVIVGVATTALVTAAAGPIMFVALAAPQLARRWARAPYTSIALAAGMGAVLLTVAHALALALSQILRPVPVGLVTVSAGGLYFLWILIREADRHRRGGRS